MISIEKEITTCEEQLLTAVRNHDADALATLIHDALIFHLPNGEPAGKAADIDAYRSGNMHVSHISASERMIHAVGNDTAIVSVCVRLQGEYFDQTIDGSFRYLRVWKRTDAGWQIIAGSCTMLAE